MSKQLDHMGVSAFCESMGMMVRSGIQVDEAVSLLQHGKTKTGGVLETGLAAMQEHVNAGEGMAEAKKASGIFPDYALQMVEAGETSGKLEGILFRLARYYADQKTISEKLKNAITYPSVMIVLIIMLLAVMIKMVLPSFTSVYERLTGSIAASAYGYVRWAYVFCWVALIVLIVIAAVLLIGYHMWKSGKRESVEALLRKFPVCASILEDMAMFRFTSALATFIASGDMQDEAVEKSIPMADYGPVNEKLERVRRQMQEGHSIAQAAYNEELFEPTYGRMLLAGERSGNLEDVLERLTGLLEENCGNGVDRLVGFVDPLLSGVLMVTVGLSLLSVMLPLIGMMNSVG